MGQSYGQCTRAPEARLGRKPFWLRMIKEHLAKDAFASPFLGMVPDLVCLNAHYAYPGSLRLVPPTASQHTTPGSTTNGQRRRVSRWSGWWEVARWWPNRSGRVVETSSSK